MRQRPVRPSVSCSGFWTASTRAATTSFSSPTRGGAWLVGVDWKTVLPPWFKVLSATAQADEYTRRITGLVERHCGYESDRMLVVARKIARPAQRQALDRVRRTRGTGR
jgi:hypothetical protein